MTPNACNVASRVTLRCIYKATAHPPGPLCHLEMILWPTSLPTCLIAIARSTGARMRPSAARASIPFRLIASA
jgi:hypothetical protein